MLKCQIIIILLLFLQLLLLLFLQIRRDLSQRLLIMVGADSNAVFQVMPEPCSAQLYSQGLQPEPRRIWKQPNSGFNPIFHRG